MSEVKTVKLKSGSELKVIPAYFSVSKKLYQAIVREGTELKVSDETDIDFNLIKDILFKALGSESIEAALWECMKSCRYNGEKITEESFESEKARQDYLEVLYHVGAENLAPFLKGLYALLDKAPKLIEKLESTQA